MGDHNMTFSSHSAPKIWCSFFGLVIWIAIHILTCVDLLHYMDDAWSYELTLHSYITSRMTHTS